ncbi:MAG: DNA repair protein [Bacilli bacterium]|nr:DNA repair protein [Bacilli bacterium]
MNRYYLCIDLKTFFASVECVERGLDPFKTDLVVADPDRCTTTICLAISPKMKSRGIRNRCRLFEIPKGINYIQAKPRMKKYIEYSSRIYGIYLKYVSRDDIHVYSIDEAFLDVTSYLSLYKMSPVELAKVIMKDIFDTTGITATAGVGTNMYLAKIALDITAKHVSDNIGYLDIEKYKNELWHHTPLIDFWQVGRGIEARLHKLGIFDMYDIAHTDENILYKEFGVNAKFLIDHSWGVEPCLISDIKKYKPKATSMSNGQVLFHDYNYIDARKVLIEMIDTLVLNLIDKKLSTNVVGFYIGYSHDEYPSLKVSKKLSNPSNSFSKISKVILDEYDFSINRNYPIKRINIWFGELVSKKLEQVDLFSDFKIEEDDERIENVMNMIKNKFGKNAILRAISYDDGATQRDRNKLIGGHNAE